jgi:transaldolase
MTNPLIQLGELGQSPWYDYITRDLVTEGELARLIRDEGLRGMTSNPTIFEKAVSGSELYDEDIRALTEEGRDAAAIFDALSIEDIQGACDIFRPTFDELANGDGTVSIEVGPSLAYDSEATLKEALRLHQAVNRPNVFVKIPGTEAGLGPIEQATAAGVNVNITLLFSVDRYKHVIEAYFRGLETRVKKGEPISHIHSVASFFVSRVDTKVDKLLDAKGDPKKIRGKTAIANACKAYQLFEATMATERWRLLAAEGGNLQRPLWASTSTTDPAFPDIYYVEALVAPYTVNTMPPDTFEAYKNHGEPKDRVHAGIREADGILGKLAESGIDLGQVTKELEEEGVEKFSASYTKLLDGLESKMQVVSHKS